MSTDIENKEIKMQFILDENGELTDIWVEEATECQEEAVNQLKVRLRGGKSKKQIDT